MHTFQPYPLELLEFNPFTLIGKNWAALSAGTGQKANVMTVSWGGMGVLWGKNVCYVFVRDSRYTKQFIDSCETFSLTFFPKEFSSSTLMYLGTVSGSREDKLKMAHIHFNYLDQTPFIDEGNLIFTCRKLSAAKLTPDSFLDPEIEPAHYKKGDFHTMYAGEIIQAYAR